MKKIELIFRIYYFNFIFVRRLMNSKIVIYFEYTE